MRQPVSRWARRSGLGSESGAAAVEFALLAPLLLSIVFAIVTYGLYFTVVIAVTEAAAVGARASVPGLSCGERGDLAQNAVRTFFDNYGPFLTPVVPSTNCAGGVFSVTVTYPITTLNLGMMSGFLPLPSGDPTATVSVSDGTL